MKRSLHWLAAPLLVALQACASSAAPAAEPAVSLVGTQWALTDLGAQAIEQPSKAGLQFLEAGRVTGHGSCNRFSGAVTVQQDRIAFGKLAATKMACMGGAMAQESAYLTALQAAQRFERQGDTLLIHAQGMDQPLRFTLAK